MKSGHLKLRITLTLQENLLLIEPVVDTLKSELSGWRRIYPESSFFRGGKPVNCRETFYRIVGNRMCTYGGFAHRVYKCLSKEGHQVRVVDTRKSLGTPNLKKLGSLRETQDKIIAAAVAFGGGIVSAPTAYGKSRLIVEIASLWNVPILVIAPSIPVVETIYSRLLERFADVGIVTGSRAIERRITVTTPMSMMKCSLADYRLGIFDEVHTSAAPVTWNNLTHLTNARLLGLSASWNARSDGATRAIEALFGPLIYRMTYKQAVKAGLIAPICVEFIEVRGTVDTGRSFTIAQKKRKLLWRNETRNKAIASLVKRLEKERPNRQILIMAATLEHCLELRKWLPDYKLSYANINNKQIKRFTRAGLWDPEKDTPLDRTARTALRNDFETRKLRKAISTRTWGQGVDFVELDTLVRVDGGRSKIDATQIPGRVSRLCSSKEYGAVYDFWDSFDETALNASIARMKQYRKHGWKIILPES